MRFLTTFLLLVLPGFALADTMPQMDFHNPLTFYQVGWMVVILVMLYFVLSGWGLPAVGKVLEHRARVIARDLEAARAAKAEADQAVAALNQTMAQARARAQGEVAEMIAKAKSRAAANAATLAARLEKNLSEAEARIAEARAQAMAALKPIATEAAVAMLARLTGAAPDTGTIETRVDAALAAHEPA
jgi:F-type H+-transporting ATPase subunit b